MHEQYEQNQIIASTRSQKVKATLNKSANTIQVNFRKLKSLKVLGDNYLEKLKNLAAKENFEISEIPKKDFIAKIDYEIKEILTNKIGITSLEKTNIHYITHNFKNIPSDKILNDLKIFRIQLDPVFISNLNNVGKTPSNELYWGEWNLSYKKHGFGFLISTKSDFYLGTFKDNVMDGVGLLIINNQNLPKTEGYKINNNNNNQNNKSQSHKNVIFNKDPKQIDFMEKQKLLDNENNACNTSIINTNLDNTVNSNTNQNSYNKARTDSLYQKETFYKTIDEKNLNELCNNYKNNGFNNANRNPNSNNYKEMENQLKQKMESESLAKFLNPSEPEKIYESKMSDFSKKMVSFLRSPKNANFINNNNNNDIENPKINKTNKNEMSGKHHNLENEFSDNEQNDFQSQSLSCDIYIGEFKRGVADGYGRLFTRTGEWYIGYFKNNQKQGEGELHFPDGSFYIGSFKNNQIEGDGKYFFKDGSHFSGNFKEGKFSGKGKMAWSDGRKYNGLWENHALSGQGTHMWANGNIFEGNYKLNAKSGKGVYYWDESKFYEGEFLNNKLNGRGLFNIGNYLLKGGWKFGKLSFVTDVNMKNRAFSCEEFSFDKFNTKVDEEFKVIRRENKEGKREKHYESSREIMPDIIENE